MKDIQNRIISFFLKHPVFFYQYVYTFFPFSDQFLSKYGHTVDWYIISSNKSLINSWSFIERYKDNLDWEKLSLEHIEWDEEKVDCYLKYIHWKRESFEINNDIFYTDSFAANSSFHWTERLIEKYKDLIDWYNLSQNKNSFWDESILNKYSAFLDWEELSLNESVPISIQTLNRFEDKWKWDSLFHNNKMCSMENMIERYPDQIDWHNVCEGNNHLINDDFIEKWNNKINWLSLSSNENYINSRNRFDQHIEKWYVYDCFVFLSLNKNLPWSVEFIEEFGDKWNWELLSMNDGLPWSTDFIERFDDYIHFGKDEQISENEYIVDLGIQLLNNFPWSIDFLERYENRWNFERFKLNESLWNKAFKPYVNQEMIDLIFRILN